jgi:hypothetical protein
VAASPINAMSTPRIAHWTAKTGPVSDRGGSARAGLQWAWIEPRSTSMSPADTQQNGVLGRGQIRALEHDTAHGSCFIFCVWIRADGGRHTTRAVRTFGGDFALPLRGLLEGQMLTHLTEVSLVPNRPAG